MQSLDPTSCNENLYNKHIALQNTHEDSFRKRNEKLGKIGKKIKLELVPNEKKRTVCGDGTLRPAAKVCIILKLFYYKNA